ncbi:MAG: GT4 family glycosyltransferase PelF, partial [Clostridium sp.]|nr:GT4 family glycosyltransferase PelF [Clostridium sp.]
MKICIVAEGCYPYIAGGVSSWIQMLIEGMPEHEFIIFTIGAEKKQRGIYKYNIPKNVIEIRENFLDEFFDDKVEKKIKYKLSEEQKNQFVNLFLGKKVKWNVIFNMFDKNGEFKANEFLCSNEFLDIIKALCREKYEQMPFNEVFWTIRSILIPILNIIMCDIPEADIYHSVSTGYAGITADMFKEKTGKPFILTEHGIYTREREEEILKADWVDINFKQTWIKFFT